MVIHRQTVVPVLPVELAVLSVIKVQMLVPVVTEVLKVNI
jgi:hypothetical protein